MFAFAWVVGLLLFSEGVTSDDESSLLRNKRAVGTKPAGVVGSCSGNFTDQTGSIASPNFNIGPYPPSSLCNWTVTVDPGSVLKISFAYMDMENGPVQKGGTCGADYITIYDRNNPETMVGGQRFCGYDTKFNDVFSTTNQIVVNFVSDRLQERSGFALEWEAVPQPEIMFSCDFEMNGVCGGWSQSNMDDFDWSFGNGRTASHNTGPFYDHTLSLQGRFTEGIYAFIEATGKRRGQKAVLVTPIFHLSTSTSHCLTFCFVLLCFTGGDDDSLIYVVEAFSYERYNMRGSGMGSLKVARVPEGQPRSSAREIFDVSGNQGELWHEARIDVNGGGEAIQFLFIGVRGSTYLSDVAIDDVTISPVRCSDTSRSQS